MTIVISWLAVLVFLAAFWSGFGWAIAHIA